MVLRQHGDRAGRNRHGLKSTGPDHGRLDRPWLPRKVYFGVQVSPPGRSGADQLRHGLLDQRVPAGPAVSAPSHWARIMDGATASRRREWRCRGGSKDATKDGGDVGFEEPVQLKCIQSPDKTLRRFIPLLVLFGICVLILAGLVFSLLLQSNLELATVLAVIVAVATPVVMYARRRRRLVHEYTHQKRLTLSPKGLRRVDATTDLELPWSGVRGIIATGDLVVGGVNVPIAGPVGGLAQAAASSARSGKAEAICGAGVMGPVPGASKRSMKVLDLSSGSRLQYGESSHAPMGIIFPAEFEVNWRHGTIGSWLRHYRPDIRLD